MDSQSRSRFPNRSQSNSRRDSIRNSGIWGFADLVLVSIATIATLGLALAYGEQGGPAALRVPLGFLFVFFLPGYALTSMLFPRRRSEHVRSERFTVTGLERLVISIGMSLVLVPLVSLGLVLLSQPITLESVLLTVGSLTVAAVVVAVIRRLSLPSQERFAVSVENTLGRGVDYASVSPVNLILVIVIAIAAGGIGAAVLTADSDDSYTEFALLSADDDGELHPSDYPSELTLNESELFHTDVTNNEHRTVEYTLVVVLEQIDTQGNTIERSELDRQTFVMEHGEQVLQEHEVTPTFAGDDLRLSYLLYAGEPPEEPTLSDAYRSTHLTVTVSE